MSKKELKAVEDAEFDTLMSKIEVEKKGESKDTKTEVVAGDNQAKNKKKKEKAKAKKEADEKAEKAEAAKKAKEVADAPAAVELTPEEKKVAVKAAMEKRGNIVVPKTTKDGKEDIASFIKTEKDKLTGGKKKKVYSTEPMY